MQQQAEDLPDHIKDLINLPEDTINGQNETGQSRRNNIDNDDNIRTVSYTHLTLPTIRLV